MSSTPPNQTTTAPVLSAPILFGYGLVVGTVGGIGAWLFRLMIGLIHNLLFLGRLDAVYDANTHTPSAPWGFLVILVPVIGSLAVVFLVRHFAPEARGHGVPEVMEAVYYEGGAIRPIVALVKAVASAISIGSGGSVGREGPIVQIGAAFGSTLGQVRRLQAPDRQLLVAAGAAAGIAATFNAPLGGVLFAIELLLVAVTARSLLVVGAAVASGIGVARLLLGSQFAFTVLDLESVRPSGVRWQELVALIVLGVGIGGAATVFNRGLYRAEDIFALRFKNPYQAHMAGMALVGLLMYGFLMWLGNYAVQGVGYATIFDILRGLVANPWVLVALAAGKWLATILTLGSGASGGVFSPSLFVGAAVGAAVAHIVSPLGLSMDPMVFALGGMAGMVAGTTGAVLTGIVMVGEMTGDFSVTVPLLVVAVTATAVRSRLSPETIYTEKLRRRGRSVPAGLDGVGRSPGAV